MILLMAQKIFILSCETVKCRSLKTLTRVIGRRAGRGAMPWVYGERFIPDRKPEFFVITDVFWLYSKYSFEMGNDSVFGK
jgi:hypothetical protein